MLKKSCLIITAIIYMPCISYASTHFDTSFFKDFSATDAKTLSGELTPGLSILSLKLNDHTIGQYPIRVLQSKAQGVAIQLTSDMIKQFHAKPKLIKLLSDHHNQITQKGIKYVSYQYDASTQSINIMVPQDYLYSIESGQIAPTSQWQFGVSGGSANYDVNATSNYSNGSTNSSVFTSLFAKYNIGRWQLYTNWSGDVTRTSGYGNSQTQFDQNFSYTYATTVLPSIKSRFMAGYNTINSPIFNAGSFYGVTLNSDLSMLPQDEQTFKPVVEGVAQTPITIALYQQGKLIYKTNLNPGPYHITNYNASSVMGDITEVITDSNGHKQTLVLPYQQITNALMPGIYQYDFNAGILENHYHLSPLFIEGDASYGLNNYLTPYVGLFLNKNYISQGLGTTLNLGKYGGISVQTGYSVLHDLQQGNSSLDSKGVDAQITYYKSFDKLGTSFNVVGYLYESRGYLGLNDVEQDIIYPENHVKNQVQLSINQSLSQKVYLNLSASYQSMWDGSRSITANLMANYYINQYVTIGLNYQQTQDQSEEFEGQTDRSITLTLSLYLGNNSITNSLSYDDNNKTYSNDLQYNYNSESGIYNTSLGVTTTQNSPNQTPASAIKDSSVNGSINLTTSKAQIAANASTQGHDNYTLGASITGGITFTPYTGFIFSNTAPDTFAIIDTEGVSGVTTGYNLTTDKDGYGITSQLTPYSYNSILLQDGQQQNGVLLDHQAYGVPVAGAILYEKFDSKVGQALFIQLGAQYSKRYGKHLQLKDVGTDSVAEHVYGNLYYLATAKANDKVTKQK